MANHYQYRPLSFHHDEIRLIKLQPGPAEADIEIEVFHEDCSSNPVYEALSYVWGSPRRTDIVLVRHASSGAASKTSRAKSTQPDPAQMEATTKCFLPMTDSLAVALRHLQNVEEPRTLWIDAICINQDDMVERSAEVCKMDSIYRRASQVIVWFGPDACNSSLAMHTFQRLANGVDYNTKLNHIEFHANEDGQWADKIRFDPDALRSNRRAWIAAKEFLRRKWFSRLWVFQEIGLATKASLMVGSETLGWDDFTVALRWIWGNIRRLNTAIDGLELQDFGHTTLQAFLSLARKEAQFLPLIDLLEKTKQLSSYDARDRLFVIRGLLDFKDREYIKPDYTYQLENIPIG